MIYNFIKRNKFYIAGVFFLILQILLIYKYTHLAELGNMFWFCSHAPIIFAIGFFTNNKNIIKAMVSVGLIIQLIWIVDYFVFLINGVFIIGAADYMVYQPSVLSYLISVFEHFSSIIALALIFKFKPEKKIFLYTFIYLLLTLILILSFSHPSENYNLTQNIIIFNEFTFPGYTFAYVFLAMLILVVPTYYLQILFYKIYNNLNIKK